MRPSLHDGGDGAFDASAEPAGIGGRDCQPRTPPSVIQDQGKRHFNAGLCQVGQDAERADSILGIAALLRESQGRATRIEEHREHALIVLRIRSIDV